ncbi:Efflux pump mlcE [Hyphodiscus hymeniophilus]|uniref:Efflux pump mlcE n=1 Tax=Hyphodiscus hymeniophilus TaxID=353542 RepID=A0A9P6VMV0_9HELO|nr:Efflux pump mlcE [Hyphodiscus hymeniophilus]
MASTASRAALSEEYGPVLHSEKPEHNTSTPSLAEVQQSSQDPTATPHMEEEQWVSGFKLIPILTAVTLACLLMLLDTSIVVTAIPRITSEFHSLADVGWYGAAYQLSSAVLQPLTGKFYSNFDSKWTFMAFFALFEAGSLICALSTSSTMLIVGRAVAGMGISGILNGAVTIIAGCVPMSKRPQYLLISVPAAQLGLVLGPLIGGLLTQFTTWRWSVLLAFSRVPNMLSKAAPKSVIRTLPGKLDLIGFTIFAPAAIQLLLALQWGGNKFAWNSAQIIGLFCGAGGMFIVFMAWDYHRGDAAMIPSSLAGTRIVWSSCLAYAFIVGQLVCVSYYLPIYFQGVKGASPTMSGVYVLPSFISHVIAAISSGFLVGRTGYYLPYILIGSIMVAISTGLLSTLSPTTSTGKWIGYQIIGGAGRGLGMQVVRSLSSLQTHYHQLIPAPQPIIAVQNTLPFTQIPDAMALLMFAQAFGGALMLSFSDTIFTNSLKNLIPKYAPSVNPQTVIDAGATGFRSFIKGEELKGVLVAYAKSVDRVFYLTAGAAVGCFAFGWFMGWKDVRSKKEVSKA